MSVEQDNRREVLLDCITQNRNNFHIEYGPRNFCNHLSQGLIALYQLGGSAEDLRSWYKWYSEKKPLKKSIPSNHHIDQSDWQLFIGQKKYWLDYTEFYHKEIERIGIPTLLRKYLPLLLEGIIGSAFHGVIQLGFALEIKDNDWMVADGLAYTTYCNKKVLQVENRVSGDDAVMNKTRGTFDHEVAFTLLEELRTDVNFDNIFEKKEKKTGQKLGFLERVDYLVERKSKCLDKYTNFTRYFNLKHSAVDEDLSLFPLFLTQAFWGCKQATGKYDFFLIHLITGFHGLKNILLTLPDSYDLKILAFKYFWQAAMIAYVIIDRPSFKTDVLPPVKDIVWDPVVKKAIELKDEHLMKVVYVSKFECEASEKNKQLFFGVASDVVEYYGKRRGWFVDGED